MRSLLLILSVLLLALQYRLWFGKYSISEYWALNQQLEQQVISLAKLKHRNKLLYADIDDLRLGMEAVEERARNELGMIKQGETFFRIVDESK